MMAARTIEFVERKPSDRRPPPVRLLMASAPATSPRRTLSRPDRRAWGVLALLTFVYVVNFLDRQLLSILAKPIQDTLHITDG